MKKIWGISFVVVKIRCFRRFQNISLSQSCLTFAISKNGGLCKVPFNKTQNHTHLGSSLVSNGNGFGLDSGETSFTSNLRPFSVIGLIFFVFTSDFRKWFVSTSGGGFSLWWKLREINGCCYTPFSCVVASKWGRRFDWKRTKTKAGLYIKPAKAQIWKSETRSIR